MAKKYKVGLVGLGWVGGAHLETFVQSERYEPAAIMSTRQLDPKEIEARYGAKVKSTMIMKSSLKILKLTLLTSAPHISCMQSRL